jgi:NADH-quinone oxidoreductase subunit J
VRPLLFILLSLLTLGGGLWVLLRRSPVDSVLGLLTVMISLSGHYMMLGAPFLAAVQLIVYGGAVVVLFLFVIMLLNLRTETIRSFQLPPGRWFYALVGAAALLALAGLFRAGSDWMPAGNGAGLPVEGTVEAFGAELFRRWVYPFELTSVLLLSALVGAVALTRRAGEPGAPEDKEA